MNNITDEQISQLKNFVIEAKIAGETSFGELQSSLRNFSNNMHNILDEQAECEETIDKWFKSSGLSEEEAVNKLCDVLEKEMSNQMDWFDSLKNMMLSWCNKNCAEYNFYKETSTGLFPLLRKTELAAVRRLLEEFQPHDFQDMFGFML